MQYTAFGLIAFLIFLWIFMSRRESSNSKELARELLRMKLLAGGEPGEYVLNLCDGVVKVAPAWDYNLALFSGMKDFWKLVPGCTCWPEYLSALERECDAGHRECGFSCIDDGHGKTYSAKRVNIVPADYNCSWVSPDEFRKVIHYAKHKSGNCYAERSPLDD